MGSGAYEDTAGTLKMQTSCGTHNTRTSKGKMFLVKAFFFQALKMELQKSREMEEISSGGKETSEKLRTA